MQTTPAVSKNKSIDTFGLTEDSEEKQRRRSSRLHDLTSINKEIEGAKEKLNKPRKTSNLHDLTGVSKIDENPEVEDGKMRNKPALFLDNLSSPSDSGSQKNAYGGQNVLNSKTSATSNGSGDTNDKKGLNYLLNRDPLKEFFHLTLQSIRMNSPHMNQILNINCDLFYKKVNELQIPFNQWSKWLEDQLNRIILSRIMRMRMLSKIEQTPKEEMPKITINKVQEDVDKMDSKRKSFRFIL